MKAEGQINRNYFFFSSSCKFFPIFSHQNHGSGSVLSLKCWRWVEWAGFTVIRFVSISAKFGICTVVGLNGTTLFEAKQKTPLSHI